MAVEITIYKPVYGSFIYIRDKYIRQARRDNVPLHITIPGIGEAYVSWEAWMDGSQTIEKEFKIPGSPMKMIGNHLSKFIEK